MIQKRTLVGILLAATLLGIVPVFSMAMPNAQEGTELLKNPGFEGLTCRAGSEPGWCLDNWSPHANFDGSTHGNIAFGPAGIDFYINPEVTITMSIFPKDEEEDDDMAASTDSETDDCYGCEEQRIGTYKLGESSQEGW